MSDLTTLPAAVDLDLDSERPATFRMQGEVFRLRQLSYRAFATADKAFMDALAAIDDEAEEEAASLEAEREIAKANGTEFAEPDVAAENSRWSRQLDAFSDFVQANVDEADHYKYDELRGRAEHGIQQRDMHTLRRWLWEAQLGRPLASAVASSPGPGSSEASSRDESGSPAVVRPT